jgi:SHS2 domain-containing protein
MKFRILSHRADVWIEATGKTIEELFKNAVLGLMKVQKTNFEAVMKNPKPTKIKIKTNSIDVDALIIDFLSDVLAQTQINKAIYQVSSIKHQVSREGANLEAELLGYPIDHFDEDVKAVTYHDAKIEKTKGEYKIKILLDI